MGVMACGRVGCDNILCDIYMDDHGYICADCLDDLNALKRNTPGHLRGSVYDFIEKFMDSPKSRSGSDDFDVEFDHVTGQTRRDH